MCNIFYLVSDCPVCSKSIELGHIDHPCFQIGNTSNSKIGTCGTVTSRLVPGPQDIVCHACCRKALQEKKKWEEEEKGEKRIRIREESKTSPFRSSVMSPVDKRRKAMAHLDSVIAAPSGSSPTIRRVFPLVGDVIQARHENETENESALDPNPSQESQDSALDGDDDGNHIEGFETIAKESQYEEAEQEEEETLSYPSTTEGLAQEVSSAELKCRIGEKQREHILHGDTNIEAPKEAPSSGPSPVDMRAALAKSRAQPPLLRTVIASDPDSIHQQTPQSATELRIESPWDTKAEEPLAEDDPWWYPEIWGPAKHLPAELARFLDRLPPAYDFHGHRIYIFCDDIEYNAIEECVTVLLVTPDGTRARIVSGGLYDEGARLVTNRQLARVRYEELSSEEREKMARGEQCCIFYPCRVACCPMLHKDGQHQPMAPKGETLLSAMERGYEWRKDWEPESPRPSPSAPSHPPGGLPTLPGHWFPIANDWRRAPSPELGAEQERSGRCFSDDSMPETETGDERVGRFAFRGRVGRIRPGYHHAGTRGDGSPVPRNQRARRPMP
ncbi:hypothetical protein ColKHC_11033 [Colletotrichum higginsianum]|uniref:Uncharacterized protein n=1 Tax=Colletotrichum higginsianum TaxID=80884 RepID=A0A4V4NC00_9PEZI|nr:hypothetical protein CH35J_006594 [Colletotrichum higginsianum]GJD02208.1 hypothetical protein ColKHC_11033 [Colletotrichum higginsianum]